MGSSRNDALPGVPTVAEVAVPNFNATSWMGVLAPAGTPKTVIDRISSDFQEVVNAPDMREKLASLGAVPVGSNPAQFQALIDSDRKRYARLISEKGIAVD
jgi:tripartite-type tricarboxylate transporter receptor subunit TctC